jgi:MFS superfamily sulfate permease-like transporter
MCRPGLVVEREGGWAIAFNRNELAGAFGDIGTDLPLILGMVAINGLDATSAFLMFGVFQLLTALRYGLPMPVQPLKAMSAIMITTGAPPEVLFGGGLVVGIAMLLLSLTGGIDWINSLLPAGVVRGIQLGLGMSLILVAFSFMQREGTLGLVVAFAGVVVVLLLSRSSRFPPALLLIGGGIILALFQGLDAGTLARGVGLNLPRLYVPSMQDVVQGGITLAIPQIPLSIANSIIATSFLVRDFFPHRQDVTPRRISLTYGLMNMASPFFSGIPVCHGSGGLAGHHRFGARTGGSVVIYGIVFIILGLFFGGVIFEAVKVFPFPILGTLLFFEGFALTKLIMKVKDSTPDLLVALLVGFIVIGLPYGYAVGIVAGSVAYYLLRRGKIFL